MSLETLFMQHIADFGLSFGTMEEFVFRKDIFTTLHEELEAFNAKGSTSTVGHNFMSTWTEAEKARLLGYRAALNNFGEEVPITEVTADQVDWVAAGKVSPVQN
jgi:hypothetical protein